MSGKMPTMQEVQTVAYQPCKHAWVMAGWQFWNESYSVTQLLHSCPNGISVPSNVIQQLHAGCHSVLGMVPGAARGDETSA